MDLGPLRRARSLGSGIELCYPNMSKISEIEMKSAVQTKEDIFILLAENQAQIKALGVKRLGLFGSFLGGKQTVESDIDFLVEFESTRKTFDNFIQLTFLLEDLFQRRVELVTTDALSPYIGPYILKEVEYAGFAA
jgi:predicted nucleotidyltransferase